MAHIFDHLLKPIKYCKLTPKFEKGVLKKNSPQMQASYKKVHEHPWFIVTNSVAIGPSVNILYFSHFQN